ncbi:MAG: hypothetical protein Q4G05_00940 [Clostridia bacterium]|nr:hypothetical protein [Clostridia bacterium]
MKLQGLTIIFIIIILPISLVLSEYVQAQIQTITNQTTYSTTLRDATYDAVKSFQLNTVNNKFSSISDSKLRDLEASISTFYNSLAMAMNVSGYTQEDLQGYIPAVVYTLYDGYYIYSKYTNQSTKQTEYGVKPYIYYTARYVVGTNCDFVINYTLDNYISIKGIVNNNYVNESGFLINPSKVTNEVGMDSNGYPTSLNYDGLTITSERLKEYLIIVNDKNESMPATEYEYAYHNNNKVYFDKENNGTLNGKYFIYSSNRKMYIEVKPEELYQTSAVRYYHEAKKFSNYIQGLLGDMITAQHAVNPDGTKLDISINTGSEKLFNFTSENDPMLETSNFNEHRREIIKSSIQTNLQVAINTYNGVSTSTYEFALPKLSEIEWDKVVNNIGVISFMQGIPIGSKYFNDYCVITNNKNKEYISKDSICITTSDNEFHKVGCKKLVKNQQLIDGAYHILDFERQNVKIAEGNTSYFYPRKNLQCYDCIINIGKLNSIEDIISGNLESGEDINILRTKYLTALAREKYELYKTTK